MSSVTLAMLAVMASVGNSFGPGCAQGGLRSCSARAATLLWQVEHTVPGGVNTWPTGIVQLLLMGVDGACRVQTNDGQALLAEALTDHGIAFRTVAGPDQLTDVPWRVGDAAIIMAHGTSDALAKAVLTALLR